MGIIFWGLVIGATCAFVNNAKLAKGILCIAGLALLFNVSIAFASGSPWKCTLHGAGMKTVCTAK